VVVNDIDETAAGETVRLILGAGGRAIAEPGAVGAAEIASDSSRVRLRPSVAWM